MKNKRKDPNIYPPGWDYARVRRVLDHYENQTEDEAVAEDEAAWAKGKRGIAVSIPIELLPAVRALIAKNEKQVNVESAPRRRKSA